MYLVVQSGVPGWRDKFSNRIAIVHSHLLGQMEVMMVMVTVMVVMMMMMVMMVMFPPPLPFAMTSS